MALQRYRIFVWMCTHYSELQRPCEYQKTPSNWEPIKTFVQNQNVEQQTPKNALLSQRNRITSTNQTAHIFLLQTLKSQQFFLIPKENYIKKQSRN